MKKNIFIYAVVTTFLLTTSCGHNDKASNKKNNPAIKVKVAQVDTSNSNAFIAVSGKVQTVNSSNLSTRMMGFVTKIHVKIGDKVKKGQLLLSIDNADLSAKLAQANARVTEAQAALNNAEKDYNRFENLFNNNSASQKEFDDATAQYNMVKARLEGANQMKKEVQGQFDYINIRAPFKGIVSNKFINEGDMANPGMPLLEVETPGEFQVMAMVPETEISQIKNNATVNVQVNALSQTVKGRVSEISASAKNTGGQYLVKILLDKSDSELLSGMFATVQFSVKTSEQSGVVLIPASALVTKGELSGIYTVSETNTALLRWLRLGRKQGDMVEVLSGLNESESYIVESEGKLFNGANVSVQ